MDYKKVVEDYKRERTQLVDEAPKEKLNCMDCPAHKVIKDPDPNDWFNRDDEAVLCTLTHGNPECDDASHYLALQQNMHRCITASCRPYHKRAECNQPDWCPKLPQQKADFTRSSAQDEPLKKL